MDPVASGTPPFAVLWDMDGVIVDSGPYHFRAWQEAFDREGVAFDHEDFRRTFGQRNDAIIADVIGPDLADEWVDEIAQAKEECYRALIAEEGIEPLPGAMAWIRRLHDWGIPQAVVSSAPMENITTILEVLEAEDMFQTLVSGEQVDQGKPDPASFLLASERLDVPPSRCVVVEDAPAGVEAARRAGMPCLALTTTHPADKLSLADQVADSLANLPPDTFARLATQAGR